MSRMKGKWAQGIKPRNFAWIIRDRLAICERPGGYGVNHRRVRRQAVRRGAEMPGQPIAQASVEGRQHGCIPCDSIFLD